MKFYYTFGAFYYLGDSFLIFYYSFNLFTNNFSYTYFSNSLALEGVKLAILNSKDSLVLFF